MGFFNDPTGLIAFSLLAAAIAAVPISRAILARYRHRIKVLMAGGGPPGLEPPIARPGARAELRFERKHNAEPPVASPIPNRWSATSVYAIAGVAWAAIATGLTLQFNQLEPSVGKIVALGAVFLWPVIPPVARMGGWGSRPAMLGPFGVLGMGLLLGTLLGGGVARAMLIALGITMLPPSATFFIVSRLGLPTVGPWVAGFLSAWLLALYVGLAAIVSLGGAPDAVTAALVVAVITLAVFVGRGVVRFVARLYLEKRISVEMLSADIWWAVFTGWLCIWLSSSGQTSQKWLGVLAGAASFVVYRGLVTIGLRAVEPSSSGPRLLLLRVFGHSSRTEQLIRSVGQRWRRFGSIQLIAAPDVAAVTLDPPEFLQFLGGRLDRAFIKDEKDLQSRLADVDLAPDPDGTRRVIEFFCQNDAWRMTLQALARDANAVLMDLRGFGSGNAGCVYELGQLVDLVPTANTVLVIDDSTDVMFLEQTLRNVWGKMRADSPNRGQAPSPLRLIDASKENPDSVAALLTTIGEASYRRSMLRPNATMVRC